MHESILENFYSISPEENQSQLLCVVRNKQNQQEIEYHDLSKFEEKNLFKDMK